MTVQLRHPPSSSIILFIRKHELATALKVIKDYLNKENPSVIPTPTSKMYDLKSRRKMPSLYLSYICFLSSLTRPARLFRKQGWHNKKIGNYLSSVACTKQHFHIIINPITHSLTTDSWISTHWTDTLLCLDVQKYQERSPIVEKRRKLCLTFARISCAPS